ncbi:MAG TPA: phosphoribosylformylglycinamidine synthase subunit PurS [Syntrophomonadaceae bacterium]|nr:phosphoribosylformylglycinamidine synthase subunit PurS [Syntrophomonadaceae bacterium]
MFKANVYVTLKEGVLDPQGEAVRKSLHVLDYQGVEAVRIGKFIEVWLDAADENAARTQVAEMSDKLLANPIIEDFRVEMTEVE